MKTKEELNALKTEVEALCKKLSELTEEELIQVTGGTGGNTSNVCEMIEASEPTIVDSDKAKEVVKYTAELVLKQTSQGMLASTNQIDTFL